MIRGLIKQFLTWFIIFEAISLIFELLFVVLSLKLDRPSITDIIITGVILGIFQSLFYNILRKEWIKLLLLPTFLVFINLVFLITDWKEFNVGIEFLYTFNGLLGSAFSFVYYYLFKLENMIMKKYLFSGLIIFGTLGYIYLINLISYRINIQKNK